MYRMCCVNQTCQLECVWNSGIGDKGKKPVRFSMAGMCCDQKYQIQLGWNV
jgi:hypothetical protein